MKRGRGRNVSRETFRGPSPTDTLDFAHKVQQQLQKILESKAFPLDGHFYSRIDRFTNNLLTWGARTNLTARHDDPAEVAFHVADSLAPLFLMKQDRHLSEAFGDRRRLLDVGSGAGFPGLILAAATELHVTLLESRRRRASFLAACAHDLDLEDVAIMHRSDLLKESCGIFDTVSSRAVGETSLELAERALRPGGIAVYWLSEEQPIPELNGGLGLLASVGYQLKSDRHAKPLKLAIFQKPA